MKLGLPEPVARSGNKIFQTTDEFWTIEAYWLHQLLLGVSIIEVDVRITEIQPQFPHKLRQIVCQLRQNSRLADTRSRDRK